MMNIQMPVEAGIKVNGESRRENKELKRLPGAAVVPEWWAAIPEGEKTLLHAIARMLRSAKRSKLQEVARAAAKWERGIGCFIKVRLIAECRKRRPVLRGNTAEGGKRNWQFVDSGWVRIEGQSAAHGLRSTVTGKC
jgi:hypothetical protein